MVFLNLLQVLGLVHEMDLRPLQQCLKWLFNLLKTLKLTKHFPLISTLAWSFTEIQITAKHRYLEMLIVIC